jgi:hypothetical protein
MVPPNHWKQSLSLLLLFWLLIFVPSIPSSDCVAICRLGTFWSRLRHQGLRRFWSSEVAGVPAPVHSSIGTLLCGNMYCTTCLFPLQGKMGPASRVSDLSSTSTSSQHPWHFAAAQQSCSSSSRPTQNPRAEKLIVFQHPACAILSCNSNVICCAFFLAQWNVSVKSHHLEQ